MKVVTADEMRWIDNNTIEAYGISGSVLMERAGLAVAETMRDLFPERKKAVILCGGGNNGGDGLVAARNLFNWGWSVRCLIFSQKERLSADCLAQYQIAAKTGVPVEFRTKLNSAELHGAIAVDAIFGTGLSKPVLSPISDIIRFLNGSGVKIVSVDVPSGISSDNGQVMGEAIRADYTVTFGLPKIGHIIHPGAEFAGTLYVRDIGFPDALLKSGELMTGTLERDEALMLLPERFQYSHKGDYGHILVVAGSRGKTGAALMTARACLRAGAGMVTLGVPETLTDIFQARVTEEMIMPLPDSGDGSFSAAAADKILSLVSERIDVLAMGPGIGVSEGTKKMVEALILKSTAPMVIDADAINVLSGRTSILKKAKAPVILTPHSGEMKRLLQKDNAPKDLHETAIVKDIISTVRSFSKTHGVDLVLKGAPSLVSAPDGRVTISRTGNPGMATAGSGDILTGTIAGLLGQGMFPHEAAVLGVYLHGLAGDIAALCKGMHSLIATDLIEMLPEAFMELKKV